VQGVAYSKRCHPTGELLGELVIDVGVDNEALAGDAGLAVVGDPSTHRDCRRGLYVSAGQDDEGVSAAEFEQDLLDVVAGRGRH
jgi:hypothetical protein